MFYYDLAAISTATSPQVQANTLTLLETLGYTTLAIETIVQAPKIHTLRTITTSSSTTSSSSSSSTTSRKRKRSDSSSSSNAVSTLQRVTIQLTKTNDFDLIGSSTSKNLERFDLVAVMPTTEAAFVTSCAREDIDLIAIDASCRLPFRPKPALVSQAIGRGVYFELRYSGGFQSDTCRQYFIANVKTFVRCCRGRGLICSSASTQLFGVRGHHDLANLMCLCGVKGMERALTFVGENCEHVVQRARTRRLLKMAKEKSGK